MEFKESDKRDIKIKACFAGLAGSGKTMSARRFFKGFLTDTKDLGIIQTEAGRAQLYDDRLGKVKVLEMSSPFEPGKFVEAISVAERLGLKALIIDSLSDEWAGIGGALDMHQAASEITKNGYTAWKNITPKHEAVLNKILSSPLHIICTVKKKADYVLETVVNKQGKEVQQPKKVGLADIQREGVEYRWMLQMDIDLETHKARVVKDNTGIFNAEEFQITEETGLKMRKWILNEK